MPIVNITLFQGRDEESKATMARAVADAVAENAGVPIDSIHVLFHEMPRDGWSRGLSLASRRKPIDKAAMKRSDYALISRISYDPSTEADYLNFRRTTINPLMASHEGFVSSLMLRPHDGGSELLMVNKWISKEHADAYRATPVHDDLKKRTMELLPAGRSEPMGADVIHLDKY
jgi:4-oxalocrotonate tautomerase